MTIKKKIYLLIAILAVIFLGSSLYYIYGAKFFASKAVEQAAKIVTNDQEQFSLAQKVLGYEKPRYYLLLFLNNTEIRPGGGFIGVYGVVKFDKGLPEIVKVEGTEILDIYSHITTTLSAPAPLTKYLLINNWQFRDSNWSPDFARSAATSLELYRQEKGVNNQEISGVIGFTPTVMEEFLKISGPLVYDGEEYNSSNFTAKLEYATEYGYKEKNIKTADRKKLVDSLARATIDKLALEGLTKWKIYFDLANLLIQQKQIMFYSLDSQEQSTIVFKDWGGLMKSTPADYLLWSDANLGAWKTDASIARSLEYQITALDNGYVAKAEMTFVHHGEIDWRTSRYRDYARIFVPVGSTLIKAEGAMEKERSTKPGVVDVGIENGRQWFGTFIAVEPGQTKKLSFTYKLPDNISDQIRSGKYNLLVQKQLGTIGTKLTVRLNFDKKLSTTSIHIYQSDLNIDREFSVNLKE